MINSFKLHEKFPAELTKLLRSMKQGNHCVGYREVERVVLNKLPAFFVGTAVASETG
jgi:hypothetical protein